MNRSKSQLVLLRITLTVAASVILFLATTPRQVPVVSDINDKFNHILAFFVLALLADGSFPGKNFFLFKFLPLMAYGLGIECIQYFLPFRECSVFDVTADAMGIVLYLLAWPVLKKGLNAVFVRK